MKRCHQQQYRWYLIDERWVEEWPHLQLSSYLTDHRRSGLDRRPVLLCRGSVCAEDRRRSSRSYQLEERLQRAQVNRLLVSTNDPIGRNCSHHTHTDETWSSGHGRRNRDHRPKYREHAVLGSWKLDSAATKLKWCRRLFLQCVANEHHGPVVQFHCYQKSTVRLDSQRTNNWPVREASVPRDYQPE